MVTFAWMMWLCNLVRFLEHEVQLASEHTGSTSELRMTQRLGRGASTYTYDGAGNQVSRGTDTFTWDYANRLAGATVGGTAATYAYDADGIRTRKVVGGSTTNFLWDRETGLPELVDDGSRVYLDGDGLIAEVDSSTGAASYGIADALDSVRGATDGAGTMTATADFDVYGGVRASTGSLGTFRYTGEQFDPESGLTFLRARSLDTATGRFLSIDTVQPNAPGTQGWNLYGYVAANPSTWTDPSGHSPLGEAAVVQGDAGNTRKVAAAGLAGIGAYVVYQLEKLICALTPICARIHDTITSAAGGMTDWLAPGPKTWNPPTPPWPDTDSGGESETSPGGRTGPKPRTDDDPGASTQRT